MARAALKSMAFGLRKSLERLHEVTDIPPSSVAVGGGMLRTEAFCIILADVLGRGIDIAPGLDVSAALVALNAESVHAPLDNIEPDAEKALRYNDLYARWRRVRADVERIGLE